MVSEIVEITCGTSEIENLSEILMVFASSFFILNVPF
jgi:hypothetical protein